MAELGDFVVGCRAQLRLRFVDEIKDAETRIPAKTAINLTNASEVKFIMKLGSAAAVEKAMSKEDQGISEGYANYTFTSTDLDAAGQLIVRGKFKDGSNRWQKSPEPLVYTVVAEES
jgi:hypothetical protein